MKLSKKILSIVLSALMVISMLPMTALAATTLTKETNTANSTYASVVLYNGVDYIAYAYSGFTPITSDPNNAIGEITINKGQTLSFNNGCSQMNGERTTPATLGWHWGAKASWGGTYYCIATDKAFEGKCSDTSVSVGMSGFGSTTVGDDNFGPNKTLDITTSYVTTAFNNVGTYYITISYKYQMKSKTFRWSTQNEIASSDVLKVNVVCPHTNGSQSANNGFAATCTKDGKESDLVCKDCGATTATGSVLTATGHNLVNVEAKAPTCIAKGNTAGQKCTNCEYTTAEEIEMTAHTYGAYTKTDANNCIRFCTTDGCTAYESTTHTWDEGEVTEDETCEGKGVKTFTCTTCGQTKTADINEKGHAYPATWTAEDETNHVKVCGNDANHVMREVHNPVSANNAVAPQIGVAGKEADTVCSVCGYVIAEGDTIDPLTGPDNTANLTLDSEISFNLSIDTDYYLENEFSEGTTADDVEYVVSYNQQTVEVGQPEAGVAINATVEAIVADGKTLIKVETAPAQLTEEISVVLKAKDNSESVTVLDGYSMKDYCDAVISRNGTSKAVCEELVRYAATAQVNFGYNTENMADEVDAPFISQLNADYTALGSYNTPAAVSNDIDVAIAGVSYVALSDATVRFYLDKDEKEFYAANGCTYGECELTMTMQEQTGSRVYAPYFAKTDENGKVYIAVPGIESANLDNTFELTMTTKSGKTMTINYAATTFCKSAVANGSETLKNLAKAIVLYNNAANERFA